MALLRKLFTPPRLVAWRRLYYHLAGGFLAVLAATISAHPSASPLWLVAAAWSAYRTPAALYMLGYVANSMKAAEDSANGRSAGSDA